MSIVEGCGKGTIADVDVGFAINQRTITTILMSKVLLLLFDRNDEFPRSLQHFAASREDLDVISISSDVDEMVEGCLSETPDVVLYASSMLNTLDADVVTTMRAQWPHARHLRLTLFDDSVYDEYAVDDRFDGSVPRADIEKHLDRIVEEVLQARQLDQS